MKRFLRITTRIGSSFDWLIRQVENHEALVNSTIRDVAEAAGRAKAQIKRVEKDGSQLRRKTKETENTIELWRERAIEVAATDEARALECLKRKKQAENELKLLEEQSLEHGKLEKQLKSELSVVEERLKKLKRDRNIMRTREARAQALNSLPTEDTALFSEIEEIFERWDSKLHQYELQADDLTSAKDELEEHFSTKEEESELREELKALCS